MASSGLQQVAKVLGAAGLFGVTSLIGSPIAGAVVTGVGGPILDVVTREGIDYALAKWRSEKTALNHDLQKAMQSAFANATARLETQWWETDHARRLTKDQREPIETFFGTFKHNIAWAFSDDQFSSLMAEGQALETDATARADFQRVVNDELRKYLHGHDDALYDFLRRRLVAEAALCFTEVLKTNDRAWRAWQLLLNEGVQAALNESLRKQDQLAADVAQLKSLLEELREQANELRWTQPEQRDPWGEEQLLRVHDSLARQIEEEAKRTRKTVRDEGEHTRGTVRDEGEQTRATVVEGNAEIKEGIRGLELTLTTLIKRDAPATAGELLQPALDHYRRIWNVPHSRNPNFTGRDAWLDALATAAGPAGTPLAHAIIGMGGVGKSQLAAEFAYRSNNDFTIVWWIRAEEPATLVGDLAALATELGLPVAATGKTEDVAAAARIWLEETDQRWLLIFDNAESSRDLAPHLPRLGDGRIVITSRLHVWNGLATPLDLDVLEPEDGIRFLLHRTGQTDEHGASAIVQQVDGLPLALEQAGAYIVEHGISFDHYLDLLTSYAPQLLGEEHATANTNAAVTTTWHVSIRAVANRSPSAVDLLNLCACFAPDLIPLDVVRAQADELPERLAHALTDPLAATETIGVLYRYSLVDIINETTVSMHRLVHLAVRTNLSTTDRKEWTGSAVRVMRKAFTFERGNPSTWHASDRLVPHALATCNYAEIDHAELLVMSALMKKVAGLFRTRAQFIEAKDLLERALASDLSILGSNHPTVSSDRRDLGLILRDLGYASQAQVEHEQALASDLAKFGPRHWKVAKHRVNLAWVQMVHGELVDARSHLEQALDIALTTNGRNHPRVAICRNGLGRVLRMQGDLIGARSQIEEAMRIDLAAFGEIHPTVAADRNNLGSVLKDLGALGEAYAELEQALKIDLAIFGHDHPHVAVCRNNLGLVLLELGDLEEARVQISNALQIDRRTYGPHHPAVADRYVNLGNVFRAQHNWSGAREQYEHAVGIYRSRSDSQGVARINGLLRTLPADHS